MDWGLVWGYRAVLLDGLLLTLQLSVLSILGSLVLGAVIGCAGALPGFLAQRTVGLYIEVLRNLPVVVKLFFLYFVVGLDAMAAALIGLITHQSAYIADIVTSGFRAIPREQSEVAWSCGHGRAQIFAHVLLPQVFRIVMPPMMTQFVEVVKNSATAMLIGVEELTFQTQQIESETFRGFEAATTATLLYVAVALAVAGTAHAFGRRLRRA